MKLNLRQHSGARMIQPVWFLWDSEAADVKPVRFTRSVTVYEAAIRAAERIEAEVGVVVSARDDCCVFTDSVRPGTTFWAIATTARRASTAGKRAETKGGEAK